MNKKLVQMSENGVRCLLSPHPEEPGDALAAAGVSKDEGACSVFAAILRDGRRSASQTRVNALMAALLRG